MWMWRSWRVALRILSSGNVHHLAYTVQPYRLTVGYLQLQRRHVVQSSFNAAPNPDSTRGEISHAASKKAAVCCSYYLLGRSGHLNRSFSDDQIFITRA